MKSAYAGAAFCLVVQIAWAVDIEPSYQGRTFSEWASQINFTEPVLVGQEPPAYVAIRHIGTNAIPILLCWISDQQAPKAMPNQVYKPSLWFSPDRVEAAAMLFGVLGAEARPAIPELTRDAMKFPDCKRYDECVRALSYIGTNSLPAFNTLLTQGSPDVQVSAFGWLPVFHADANVLLPAMIKCLVGKNDNVGDRAAQAVADLDIPPAVLVPAITNALPSATIVGRLRVINCLKWMALHHYWDPTPKEIEPTLRVIMCDSNKSVSNSARDTIQVIKAEKDHRPKLR